MATKSTSGQWSAAANVSAKLASWVGAAYHSTKPPGIERAAEPEPSRDRQLSSRSERPMPSAAVAASDNAAKADADEAIPAPVGKLLAEVTEARCVTAANRRT